MKNPEAGSTAGLPLASKMSPSEARNRYFFKLPGQCTSPDAWNTVIKRSFRFRVRLKLLTDTVGDVNVVCVSRIAVTMLVNAVDSDAVSSAVK